MNAATASMTDAAAAPQTEAKQTPAAEASGSDIFAAALQGDLASMRSLLAHRDERMGAGGYTALGLAVSAGHVEIVRLLLREGVTIDAADDEGVTALMHAAMHGCVHVPSPRHACPQPRGSERGV